MITDKLHSYFETDVAPLRVIDVREKACRHNAADTKHSSRFRAPACRGSRQTRQVTSVSPIQAQQRVEASLRCLILNLMTMIGYPVSVRSWPTTGRSLKRLRSIRTR